MATEKAPPVKGSSVFEKGSSVFEKSFYVFLHGAKNWETLGCTVECGEVVNGGLEG